MSAADVADRFWRTLRRVPDLDPAKCWPWPGTRMAKGYGVLRRRYAKVYAHRVSYEIAYGPVPEGLVIDHICRNRLCCNPAHLEAVTTRENAMRGAGLSVQLHNMGICIHGHEVSGSNVYSRLKANGERHDRCRECILESNRKSRERRRGKLSPNVTRDAVRLLDGDVIANDSIHSGANAVLQ